MDDWNATADQRSYCSEDIDSGYYPLITYDEVVDYLDFGDSSLTQQHLYQTDMSIDAKEIFGDGFIQESQFDELFRMSQSCSPLTSSSMHSVSVSDCSQENSSVIASKINATITEQVPVNLTHQMKIQADSRYNPPLLSTSSRDDLVMAKAMMAVISSTSLSSSSSSTSLLPMQPAQSERSQANIRFGAFKPYNAVLQLKFEPKLGGQNMFKKSISLLSSINSMRDGGQTAEESRSSNIQSQHIISERKRREKLNDSFHTLRLQLPSGTKKDKASVLTSTRNYLNTLKAQIVKLQKENTMLDMHLSPKVEYKDANCSIADVEIIDTVKLASGMQQIDLDILVRRECDMVELVLRILEYLKGMGFTSLMSCDVNICSPQLELFLRATLKLQIKASAWDEKSFKESMRRAVDGIARTLS